MVTIKGFFGLDSRLANSGGRGIAPARTNLSNLNVSGNFLEPASSLATSTPSRSSPLGANERQELGEINSVGAGVTALRDIVQRIQSLNTRLEAGANGEASAIRTEITALTNEYNSIAQSGNRYVASDLSAFENQAEELAESSTNAVSDLAAASTSLVDVDADIAAANAALAPTLALIDGFSSSIADNSLAIDAVELAMGDLPSSLTSYMDASATNSLAMADYATSYTDQMAIYDAELSSANDFATLRDAEVVTMSEISTNSPDVFESRSSQSALSSVTNAYYQASNDSVAAQASFTYYEDLYITSGQSDYSDEYSSFSDELTLADSAYTTLGSSSADLVTDISTSFGSSSADLSSAGASYDAASSLSSQYENSLNSHINVADPAFNLAADYANSSLSLVNENTLIDSSIASINTELGDLVTDSASLVNNEVDFSSSITSLTTSLTVLTDLSSESSSLENRISGLGNALSSLSTEAVALSAAYTAAAAEVASSSSSTSSNSLGSGLREISIQDGLRLDTSTSTLRKVSAEILTNRLQALQVGAETLSGEAIGIAQEATRENIEEVALAAQSSSLSSTEADDFAKALAGSIAEQPREAYRAIGSLNAEVVENLVNSTETEKDE